MLEYSHDGGISWDFVRHSCYPRGQHLTGDHGAPHTYDDVTSHVCTGAARSLDESSRYHAGDYGQWTRVTVPVGTKVASK